MWSSQQQQGILGGMSPACVLPTQSQDVPWDVVTVLSLRWEQGNNWEQEGFDHWYPTPSPHTPEICRNGSSLSRASAPWTLLPTFYLCLHQPHKNGMNVPTAAGMQEMNTSLILSSFRGGPRGMLLSFLGVHLVGRRALGEHGGYSIRKTALVLQGGLGMDIYNVWKWKPKKVKSLL